MIKFTFAQLDEKAECYKNYRVYICDYFYELKDLPENAEYTNEHLYKIIGDKWGLHLKSVERIVKRKNGKIQMKKPKGVPNGL